MHSFPSYADLTIGESASLTKKFGEEAVSAFAGLSLDYNPVHFDEEFAKNSFFGKRIIHGMLYSSLISGVLASKLPGPGTIYLHQSLDFLKPVYLNDEITATVTVVNKSDDKQIIELSTDCFNQAGTKVVKGKALVKFL